MIERIIGRDLKCGVNVATANTVWPNLVKTYPTLLCNPYDEKNAKHIKFPAIFQLKSDGLRANAIVRNGVCEFFARSGLSIDINDGGELASHFVNLANGKDLMFDGELLAKSNSGMLDRKTGNGIANRAIRGTITPEESKMLYFSLWDVVDITAFDARYDPTGYSSRFERLKTLCSDYPCDRIVPEESTIVNSWDEINVIFDDYILRGLEGGIVKNLNTPWEDGRSKNQVKLKAENTCELKCTGWNYGVPGSKYEKHLGSLAFESADGIVKVNVSGFSDDQRKTLTPENTFGRIATVLYNTRITKKTGGADSLFLPRIVEFRDDKTEADTSDLIK